jgi:hypothetical protein
MLSECALTSSASSYGRSCTLTSIERRHALGDSLTAFGSTASDQVTCTNAYTQTSLCLTITTRKQVIRLSAVSCKLKQACSGMEPTVLRKCNTCWTAVLQKCYQSSKGSPFLQSRQRELRPRVVRYEHQPPVIHVSKPH